MSNIITRFSDTASRKTALAALLTALFLPMAAPAQELHENINVQGTYKPDIVKAERFNEFPTRMEFDVERSPLEFDTNPVTADFGTRPGMLGIYGWGTRRKAAPKGYLYLSAGSWLNSSLSAGYSVIRKPDTRLNISLQHNSTSLWNPYSEIGGTSKRYRYDESLAADFSHTFRNYGTLSAQLQYHFGRFNYFFYLPPEEWEYIPPMGIDGTDAEPPAIPEAPAQTVNDIAFTTTWSAAPKSSGSWSAGIRARHFAYRSLFMLGSESHYLEPTRFKGDRETRLGLFGGYTLDWLNGSSIGIDADFDLLLYSLTRKEGVIPELPSPDNYGMLSLNPYYRFTRERLIINIGATVDFAFNAQGNTRDTHYSLFHIAPDLRADWRGDDVALYLHIGGGSRLRTLADQAYTEYYGMPALNTTQPRYIPIDARLGADFGSFSGFRAGFSLAYRHVMHEGFPGWYPALLNCGTLFNPAITPDLPGDPLQPMTPLYSLWIKGRSLNGFKAEIHAEWTWKELLNVKGALALTPRSSKFGWIEDNAESVWHVDAALEVHPIEKLTLGLNYLYRGNRAVTLQCKPEDKGVLVNGGQPENSTVKLSDISDLGAEVRWDFTKKFSVGVKGSNLLNKHRFYLPALPSQGIDIQGMVSFRF